MSEILKEGSYPFNKIVKFINFEGKMCGEKSYQEVYELSLEQKHDIMLVKELDGVPLVKFVNYGKMLYEQKKALKKQRANIQESKEIKFGLNIGEHDFNIKLKHVKEFLEEGIKVKVTIQLNGREVEHSEFAIDLMKKVIENLEGIGITEDKMEMNGRYLSMNFTKKKDKKK